MSDNPRFRAACRGWMEAFVERNGGAQFGPIEEDEIDTFIQHSPWAEGVRRALTAVEAATTGADADDETARFRAALSDGQGFACAAKKQGSGGGNDPTDCGWPFCGCDPAAARVLDAIDDAGCVFVPREATPAMLEAGRVAQGMGDETLDAGDMAAKWRAMLEAAGVG